MSNKKNNIKYLFTSGKLQQVYKSFLKNQFEESHFTWILGTLCFLGKLDEALIIIKKRKLEASEYFFLITAAIRKSDYDLSAQWFRELSKLSRISDENKFFYTQALAFYAYYKCRYKNCLTIVMRSRVLSIGLKESFWKVLALDLLGHTHMQMGNIHKGLMHLEEAYTLAELLENLTFKEATQISILTYQAQFTDNPNKHISLIEKKLRHLSANDNYSESSLLLSLAHLQLLTGEQTLAEKSLLRAQKIIFSSALPRHKSLWYFEKAYSYYLIGSMDLALNFLIEAEATSNVEIDKKAYLKILGLKRSIFSLLNKNTELLDKELVAITKLVGDALSINKLARMNLMPKALSEDPLQNFFDQLSSSDWTAAIPGLIQTEYFGMLREKMHDKKSSYMVTGLWKKGILILTKSGVLKKPSGISEMLLKALVLLSEKKYTTKEEIVSSVWGHSYDPLRHDTSVYTLIHRLREVLGPLEKDLSGENHSYYFSHNFKHLSLAQGPFALDLPHEMLHDTYKNERKWNIRQYKALKMIYSGQSFKVSEYAKEFDCSIITALRDLTELKNANQVNVYGRARATTYAQ